MKKTILQGLLLIGLSPLTIAEDLIIEKGEEYLVTPDKMNQSVEKLVIADNATISFAEGVDHWELLAADASIGYGVVINGGGKSGDAGAPGLTYDKQARSCTPGKRGKGGESGSNGYPGVDIYLGLDARKIGNLKIVADGGKGGDGGAGGAGQDAGNIVNCPAARGGGGGAGGPGGDGGRGGNVVLSVNPIDPNTEVAALTAGVRVSVKPGEAGKGGEGGKGGAGSEGTYINQKTLTGNKKWVAGGPRGRFGVTGEDGDEGSYGQVFVGGQFNGFPSISTHTDSYEGFDKYRSAVDPVYLKEQEEAQQEIKLLKEQLKMLQDRMEQLEK